MQGAHRKLRIDKISVRGFIIGATFLLVLGVFLAHVAGRCQQESVLINRNTYRVRLENNVDESITNILLTKSVQCTIRFQNTLPLHRYISSSAINKQ